MPGKCPDGLVDEFITDCNAGFTNKRLVDKYGRKARTLRGWKKKLRDKGLLEDDQGGDKNTTTFAECGNYANASRTSRRVITLEDLLDACDVDLSTWKVKEWGAKKWEVGAKIKEGHLEWSDGGIKTGHLNYSGIGVQDLWSVWAKFIRLEPIPVCPIVQPIKASASFRKVQSKSGGGRALIICDPHFGFYRDLKTGKLEPFHDRLVLDIALQIAIAIQPEIIVFLGDIVDLAGFSDKFLALPEVVGTTQPGNLEAHWWLSQFRIACPGADIRAHQGNHDKRIVKAIISRLPEFYGLQPVDAKNMSFLYDLNYLLGLEGLGISWFDGYPNDVSWILDDIRLIHGSIARKGSGATARAIVEGSDVNTVFGHIHRDEEASRNITVRGEKKSIFAWCPGCACRTDGGGTPPGSTEDSDWRNGIGLLHYGPSVSTSTIRIENGRSVWNGQVFEARERIDDIREDLPGWNY